MPGGPFGSGIDAEQARLDPTGRYLYAIEFALGYRMHRFAVDTATGTLGAPVTTALPSGSTVQGPLIDSRGEHLYQPSEAAMLAYGLDGATSALVPSNWSTAHVGGASVVSAIAEDTAPLQFVSDTVVATSQNDNVIYSFRMSASGALNARSTLGLPGGESITVGSSGPFVHAIRNNATVSTFTIDPADSTLSLFDSFSLGSATMPIAMSATGRYSYASDGADRLRTFVTNPDTGHWDSSLPQVALSTSLAEALVHPVGTFMHTRAIRGTANDSRLYRYRIDPVTGAVEAGGVYLDMGGPVGGMTLHPSGHFLYVVNTQDDVIQSYSVGATGLLAPMNANMAFVADGETSLAIDARGRFLFAIDVNGRAQTFEIGVDGQLSVPTPALAYLVSATAIAADASGDYMLLTLPNLSAVRSFRIGDDGLLVPVGGAPASLTPGVHTVKATSRTH